MNRQEKILKEYISEVLSTRSTLDERVVGSAKKAASGIASAVKGIFKGGTKGDTWAERQFATFKKEVGSKIAKKAGGFLNNIFDKFIPERMVNLIPRAWIDLLKRDISALLLTIPDSKESETDSEKRPYASYTTPNEVRRVVRRMIQAFEDRIIKETAEELGIESKEDITRQDIERSITQEDLNRIIKKVIEEYEYTITSWVSRGSRSGRGGRRSGDESGLLFNKWKGVVSTILGEIKIDKKYIPIIFKEVMKLYFRKNENKEPYIKFAEEDDIKETTLKLRDLFAEEFEKIPQSSKIDESILSKILEKVINNDRTINLVKEWEENIKEED